MESIWTKQVICKETPIIVESFKGFNHVSQPFHRKNFLVGSFGTEHRL